MGLFSKLKNALSKTRNGLSKKLSELFSKNKLGDEFYEELEEHILDYKITFTNKVTSSNSLILTFYFAVNKKTLGWLAKHKDIYDFEGFEDLCFYKNFGCEFFSCTHEKFSSLDELETLN